MKKIIKRIMLGVAAALLCLTAHPQNVNPNQVNWGRWTGCTTAGYVLSPASQECVPIVGGGSIGGTVSAPYIPIATGSDTLSNSTINYTQYGTSGQYAYNVNGAGWLHTFPGWLSTQTCYPWEVQIGPNPGTFDPGSYQFGVWAPGCDGPPAFQTIAELGPIFTALNGNYNALALINAAQSWNGFGTILMMSDSSTSGHAASYLGENYMAGNVSTRFPGVWGSSPPPGYSTGNPVPATWFGFNNAPTQGISVNGNSEIIFTPINTYLPGVAYTQSTGLFCPNGDPWGALTLCNFTGGTGISIVWDGDTGTISATGSLSNPMMTVGDLIIGGAVSGGFATPTRLAAGNTGYCLTSNGAGAAPSWQPCSGSGGGYPTPVTATVSGASEIDFDTASNPCLASQRDYEIRMDGLTTSSGTTNVTIQYSSNGGTTWDSTTSDYSAGGTEAQAFGGSFSQFSTEVSGQPGFMVSGTFAGVFSSATFNGTFRLYDVGTPNLNMQFHSSFTFSGGNYDSDGTGYYNSSSVVNAFRILAAGGTLTGSVTCQPLPQ